MLGNRVYVVWTEGNFYNRQIFFKRSIDGGATFENTTKITNMSSLDILNPQIVAANKNVYLLWQSNVSKQLFFKRSIDGGATFENATNISDDRGATFSPTMSLSNPKGQSQYPDITTFNNNIYAIWQDRILGNVGIFFKRIM